MQLSLSLTNPPRRVPIEVENGASAKDLFDVASIATNIPVTGMKLIFRGRIIASKNDEISVMEEFKLEEGSVIHCMGKPIETLPSVAVAAATSTRVSNSNAPSASTSGSTVTIPPPAASAAAAASTNSITQAPSSLTAALNKIKTSYSASDYKTALTTLSKLLSNVIQNPMEDKYRKVKNTNAAFQKRLGRLNGANDAILSIGFTTVGEEYVLQPSPDAWPKLLASKSTLDQALTDHDLQQAQQLQQQQQQQQQVNSTDMGFGGLPNFNMPDMGMGMGMPPGGGAGGGLGGAGAGGMDQSTMSNMLSDPQALQAMLQNPMMQQMIQNHPQFANNPMMQEQMRMLANNPQMIQQMSRLMSDPSNRERMNAMMQNMGGAGGMNAAGAGAGSGMDMNQQMEMMRQFANIAPGASGANNATNVNNRNSANNNASGSNQQQNQSGNNNGSNGGGGDGEMTEDEMLAEAIARSLREQ